MFAFWLETDGFWLSDTSHHIDNLYVTDNFFDRSFGAVARLLLLPRMKDVSGNIDIYTGNFRLPTDAMSAANRHNLLIAYLGSVDPSVCHPNGQGWREVQDLAVFVKTKVNLVAQFFINETEGRMAIFTQQNIDCRQYHLLVSLIPRFLPRFFKDKPLSEDESRLLKAFCNKSEKEATKTLNEFFDKSFFRNLEIQTKQLIEGNRT